MGTEIRMYRYVANITTIAPDIVLTVRGALKRTADTKTRSAMEKHDATVLTTAVEYL